MATISSDYFDRPPIMPVGRLLTAADLPALLDELPSGPVKYELDNGNLLLLSLPGEPHGEIQATIVTELKVEGGDGGTARRTERSASSCGRIRTGLSGPMPPSWRSVRCR